MSVQLIRPGVLHGAYPETLPTREDWLARLEHQVQRTLNQARHRKLGTFRTSLRRIRRKTKDFLCLSEEQFDHQLNVTRSALSVQKHSRSVLENAFALVSCVIERSLGLTLHNEQLYGGWVMIHGLLAEMQTGEGKTLTAALPACVGALAGAPVHVITTNDYLVQRDAASLAPVYRTLGLSVGTILEGMSADERRDVYRADIVYVSNKQIVFDYLKDLQMIGSYPSTLRGQLSDLLNTEDARPAPVMRGLCFAIIDEADSVLIDDAQTPLVLSQTRPSAPSGAADRGVALGLAGRLKEVVDFVVQPLDRQIEMTVQGGRVLDDMCAALGGKWRNRRYRDELVLQALSATRLYRKDEHYIIERDKIVLIDPNTGRATPDKTLSHGLHQLLEAKEGCEITDPTETLARLSYQQFFRRYHALAGMTGTAIEVADELQLVYGLSVVQIPTSKKNRRRNHGVRLFAGRKQQVEEVVKAVESARQDGRPVLIGTRSVRTSEEISLALHADQVPHRVLNARQDADEADVIAQAGLRGRVTVATNMAGRGTDIPLGEGVDACGGLHVICSELNDARRIDRQLYGRCARQGDRGSVEAILSLDDEALVAFYPSSMRSVLKRMVSAGDLVRNGVSGFIGRLPQYRMERRGRRQRAAVLKQQGRFLELLAYAKRSE